MFKKIAPIIILFIMFGWPMDIKAQPQFCDYTNHVYLGSLYHSQADLYFCATSHDLSTVVSGQEYHPCYSFIDYTQMQAGIGNSSLMILAETPRNYPTTTGSSLQFSVWENVLVDYGGPYASDIIQIHYRDASGVSLGYTNISLSSLEGESIYIEFPISSFQRHYYIDTIVPLNTNTIVIVSEWENDGSYDTGHLGFGSFRWVPTGTPYEPCSYVAGQPTLTPPPTSTSLPTNTPNPVATQGTPPTPYYTITPYPTHPNIITPYPTATTTPIIFPTIPAYPTATPLSVFVLPTLNYPNIDTPTPPATAEPFPTLPNNDNSNEMLGAIETLESDWSFIDVGGEMVLADGQEIPMNEAMATVVFNVSEPLSYVRAIPVYMPNLAPFIYYILFLASIVIFTFIIYYGASIGAWLLNIILRLWGALPFT